MAGRSLPLAGVYDPSTMGCTRSWKAGDPFPGPAVTDPSLVPKTLTIQAPPPSSSYGGGGGDGGGGSYQPGANLKPTSADASGVARAVNGKYTITCMPDEHALRSTPSLDVAGARGTPICTPQAGTVRYAGWMNGYGNIVIVDYGNGVEGRFAHLDGYSVSPGQKLTAGQPMGGMGNTGRSIGPTGVHVHIEYRKGGTHLDPLAALNGDYRPYRRGAH